MLARRHHLLAAEINLLANSNTDATATRIAAAVTAAITVARSAAECAAAHRWTTSAATRSAAARIALTLATIAPQTLKPAEHRAAFAARLAVVIAALVTGIHTVGRFVDPRIDVQFAAAFAIAASAAGVDRKRSVGSVGTASHGPDTAGQAKQRRASERGSESFR